MQMMDDIYWNSSFLGDVDGKRFFKGEARCRSKPSGRKVLLHV